MIISFDHRILLFSLLHHHHIRIETIRGSTSKIDLYSNDDNHSRHIYISILDW